MSGTYATIVFWIPGNEEDQEIIQSAIDILSPYQTSGSYEDEMTLLDLILDHDAFDPDIEADARAIAADLIQQAPDAMSFH